MVKILAFNYLKNYFIYFNKIFYNIKFLFFTIPKKLFIFLLISLSLFFFFYLFIYSFLCFFFSSLWTLFSLDSFLLFRLKQTTTPPPQSQTHSTTPTNPQPNTATLCPAILHKPTTPHSPPPQTHNPTSTIPNPQPNTTTLRPAILHNPTSTIPNPQLHLQEPITNHHHTPTSPTSFDFCSDLNPKSQGSL